MILVTPKHQVERKSEWFCGVNFLSSNFKVIEETVLEQKFDFSLMVFFHMRQFHFGFYCFFQFFGSDFFLNGFPNSFIVHSRPRFLLELNLHFSLVVFCSHAAISPWFLLFFDFWMFFFLNGFPNSFIVHSRPRFLLELNLHFSLMVFFHMRQFHFGFYCFFQFFGSDFFLNGFPNSFIVHSRPRFLLELNLHFSLVVFCSHAAISPWFLLFFDFWMFFFLNGFPNPFTVHSRTSFCV